MAKYETCKHGNRKIPGGSYLCIRCTVVSDDAKRMSEGVTLAILANPVEVTGHGWMAFKLQDGSTDNTVYPSKQVAIDHQLDEYRCAYVCLNQCLAGMPLKDAQMWLDLHRHIHMQGGRLTDPQRSLMIPQARDQPITRPVIGDDLPAGLRRGPWKPPPGV
jgi:hypothetical protein